MPRRLLALAVAGVALAGALMSGSAATAAAPRAPYIVVYKPSAFRAFAAPRGHVRHTFRSVLDGYAADLDAADVAALRADPSIAAVEPDRPVRIASQVLPTGVNRVDADRSSTLAGNGSGKVNVPIAVLDTGVGPHPDLNIAGGKNCTSSPGGWNDGNGHGTHVAGTIAAKDDGNGVVGVAPGAPIYSVRVLDAMGNGLWSDVVCGIDWVTSVGYDLGIRVANMSLEGGGDDDGACGKKDGDVVHAAICRSVAKGITYVVAAGNDAQNLSGTVPAAYNEVLTVTAMADYDGKPGGFATPTCWDANDDSTPDFTNFTLPGSPDASHVIAAPGTCIRSTWKGGGYRVDTGTSQATPHVTGTVALCIAKGPCAGLAPAAVIAKVRAAAAAHGTNVPASGFAGDPNHPKSGRYYGWLDYAGAF
jgi:subtilisin family serine protease